MIINVTNQNAARYDILVSRYNKLVKSRKCVPDYKLAQYYDVLALICAEIGELVNPLKSK